MKKIIFSYTKMRRHTKITLVAAIILIAIVVLAMIIGLTRKKTGSSIVDEDFYDVTFQNQNRTFCMNMEKGVSFNSYINLKPCDNSTPWIVENVENGFLLKRIEYDRDVKIIYYLAEATGLTGLKGFDLLEDKTQALVFNLLRDGLLKIVSGYYKDTFACIEQDPRDINNVVLNFKKECKEFSKVNFVSEDKINQFALKQLNSLDEIAGKDVLMLAKIPNSDFFMSISPRFSNNTYVFCCSCSSTFGTCDNCYNEVVPVAYHFSELFTPTLKFPNSSRPFPIPSEELYYPFKKWFLQKDFDKFYLKMKYNCTAFGKPVFDNIYFMKTDAEKPFVDLEHKYKQAWQTFSLEPVADGFHITTSKDGKRVMSFNTAKTSIEFLPMNNATNPITWQFFEVVETRDCKNREVLCECTPSTYGPCFLDTTNKEKCDPSRKIRACLPDLSNPFQICHTDNSKKYCLTENLVFKSDQTPASFVVQDGKVKLNNNNQQCLSVKDNKLTSQPCSENGSFLTTKPLPPNRLSLTDNNQCVRFWGFPGGIPLTNCQDDSSKFDLKFV